MKQQEVELQPGEEKEVTFNLDKRAFAYYNVDLKDWHVESGVFEILIGKSSVDIQLKGSIQVNSTVSVKKLIHRNTTMGDILKDPILSRILNEEALAKLKGVGPFAMAQDANAAEMFRAFMKFLPLRALATFNTE